MSWDDIWSWLYAASGVWIVLAFMPQVRAAWTSRNGARDLALSTWLSWSATSGISLAYAVVVVKDAGFIGVSLGNFLGCASVTAGVLLRRRSQGVR